MARPQFTAPRNNTRISANGTVEVNADQTSTVTAGESATTTVLADPGEVWELQAVFVDIVSTDTASSGDSHSLTVQTQQQGVELAYGSASETDGLELQSGVWNSAVAESRTSDLAVKIDDTNGIDAVYSLGNTANGENAIDRTIRFAFSVVKA